MLVHRFEPRKYFLWEYAIDLNHQNRHKGTQALREFISYLKDDYDAEEITTTYIYGNEHARHIYEKAGFVETDVVDEPDCHEVNMAYYVKRHTDDKPYGFAKGHDSAMRRKDREVSDMDQILEIIRTAKILHLGLNDGGYPYVVPLHYGYEFIDGRLVFYLHGAREGHKLDLIAGDPRVGIELECDVALIDGGEIACDYGSQYASLIGWGTAEIISDEQRKVHALKLIMENQTGRQFTIEKAMTASVGVIAVTLDEFTAKAHRLK